MGKPKTLKGTQPQSRGSAQDCRGDVDNPRGGSSPPMPIQTGAEGFQQNPDQNSAPLSMSERMSQVEGGVAAMTAMMSGIQASIDRLGKPQDTSRARSTHRKLPSSPPWMSGRTRSSRSSSRSSSSSSSRYRGKDVRLLPFDYCNFLDKSVKLDSFESLMLLQVRMVKSLFLQGEDLLGLISHIELLCEKAMTRVYRIPSLIAYDHSVRVRASAKGPDGFGQVENADVLRYFAYDSTVVASAAKTKSVTKTSGGGDRKPCFAFNKGDCKVQSCKFSHFCMYCRSQAHGASGCASTKTTK